MKEDNILHIKSKKFAIRIIHCYKFLADNKKEFVLSKQLLRSGTSIVALIAESEFAQSDKDFLNKLYIALKKQMKPCTGLIFYMKLIFYPRKNFLPFQKMPQSC